MNKLSFIWLGPDVFSSTLFLQCFCSYWWSSWRTLFCIYQTNTLWSMVWNIMLLIATTHILGIFLNFFPLIVMFWKCKYTRTCLYILSNVCLMHSLKLVTCRFKFDDECVTKVDMKTAVDEQYGGELEVIWRMI